jgi:hypothetical protein
LGRRIIVILIHFKLLGNYKEIAASNALLRDHGYNKNTTEDSEDTIGDVSISSLNAKLAVLNMYNSNRKKR